MVQVDKITLNRDKPMIIFSSAIIQTGFLKACFKLGLRARNSRYKKIHDENDYA